MADGDGQQVQHLQSNCADGLVFGRAIDIFGKIFPDGRIDYLVLIPQGYSNRTFRVSSGGVEYRVRVAGNNNIISRENEARILEAVGNEGCLFYDRETGDGIWRWIDGSSVTGESLTLSFLINLCGEMSKIHVIPKEKLGGILVHDDLEFMGVGEGNLEKEILDLYGETVEKNGGNPRCLCHNDVSLSNILQEGERIHLIDFEWGRINSPYWDFGNFIKESEIGEDWVRYLAIIARLNLGTLAEYCFMAAVYSFQLSFSFPPSDSLDKYRERIRKLIFKYREWMSGGL